MTPAVVVVIVVAVVVAVAVRLDIAIFDRSFTLIARVCENAKWNKIKWKVNPARDTVEAQSSHRHRRLTRTWPKNKRRNLLPIDPLIGPVNKNAVAEAARDREWLAPAPIVAGLAWLDWRPVPWPLNLCCRPRALFAYSSSLSCLPCTYRGFKFSFLLLQHTN